MKMIIGVLAVGFAGYACFAGDAVSEPNGKVAFFGGDMNGEDGYNFGGSYSLPVGSGFGVQFDGLYSDISNKEFYGAGGHLFWRDSELGLFGFNGSIMRESDTLDAWSVGLEAEYYLGLFTFSARGGVANLDYINGSVSFIETDETDVYATGSLAVYPWDDLMLSASYTSTFGNGLGRGQIEYLSPFPGLSIFGDVAAGDYDYSHAMVGIRYYLGKEKTLIQRHREDDPASVMHDMLYTIGTYGAEFNQKAEDYVAGISGGGSSSGGSSFSSSFGSGWTYGFIPGDRETIPE